VPPRSAVLFSGGLDSTVLLAEELAANGVALPIHVRCGLAWEDAEARTIDRLMATAPLAGRAAPAITLRVDTGDIYGANHWAVAGHPPGFDTPDEDVYLPGRNLLLVTKAAILCRQRDISRLLLGSLAGNPFPDATPAFLAALSSAVSLGLEHPFEIVTPYLTRRKHEVVRRGRSLGVPVHLTLSCMNPTAGDRHCGACSKCREREEAFREAGGEMRE